MKKAVILTLSILLKSGILLSQGEFKSTMESISEFYGVDTCQLNYSDHTYHNSIFLHLTSSNDFYIEKQREGSFLFAFGHYDIRQDTLVLSVNHNVSIEKIERYNTEEYDHLWNYYLWPYIDTLKYHISENELKIFSIFHPGLPPERLRKEIKTIANKK